MKILLNMLAVALVSFSLMSCSSSNSVKFNDSDIEINVLSVQSNADFRSYNIEVTNKGKPEIFYLNLYISFPIKQPNGSKGSPYKVEGRTDQGKPINLKTNEKINFTVIAPIKEVFGESNQLDFDRPYIHLDGYVKDGEKDIPFGITRGT